VLVILLVMITLCSDGIGDELCKQMDKYQTKDSVARSDSWIELLASILLMDECLHWNWIKREELVALRKYIPLFLKRYKAVVNRKEGVHMKILKYHLFTHVADVFENFGLFKAVDTERTEAAHKDHKQAGQRTTRNPGYVEQDVALQFYDQQIIMVAKDLVERNVVLFPVQPLIDLNLLEPTLQKEWHYVNARGCYLIEKATAGNPLHLNFSSWGEDLLTNSIVSFLQQEVINGLGLDQIDLFTAAKIVLPGEDKYTGTANPFTVSIRAHPNFKSHASKDGYPLYHWVYLKCAEGKILLCRCLAFCEIDGVQYIVGQCNDTEPYLIRNGVQNMLLGVTIDNDSIRLIPLSDVAKTAIVIPNDLDQTEPISKWILVRELAQWCESFKLEWEQVIKRARASKNKIK
jgi:hypothetical protein